MIRRVDQERRRRGSRRAELEPEVDAFGRDEGAPEIARS